MNYQLPFKSGDKIAELGGGENPTFHPNFDARNLKNVYKVIDFNKPLPIQDNSYNGIYSRFVLEHLSWRTNKLFLSEIYRILIPNGIAVIMTSNLLEQIKVLANNLNWTDKQLSLLFGDQRLDTTKEFDEDWDFNAHHSGYHPEYITKTLKDIGFQKINILPIVTEQGPIDMIIECTKPDTQIIDATFKKIDSNNNIKLNIGLFKVMHKNDWINIDILDLTEYAKQNNFIFRQADCPNNIPYEDNMVDLLIASHFIEHLSRQQGKQLLNESFRIMKPGSIIRLTIPDAEIITKDYISKTISRHSSHNEGVKNAEDSAESLFHLLIAGHQTIYDFDSLSNLLQKTGFVDIKKQEYQKSYSKEIENETIDMFPELSLYIEAKKPLQKRTISTHNINDVPIHYFQPRSPIITKGTIPSIESKQEKQHKFSIVYSTYRPGSMDLLFNSLSNQTYKNFELFLIDDYSPRTNNKQELYNQLKEKQKPTYLKYHDPPNHDCFGKFYRYGINVNTGFIESIKSEFNSDIIIILQDNTYLPEDQLEKWNKAFNETGLETIITGTGIVYSAPNPTKWNNIYSTWENDIIENKLIKYLEQWTPTEYEGFYTGIPRDIVVRLNGLDENIDYPCEQANDFFERAKISDYKLIVNNQLNCIMIDHRHWHPPDTKDDYLWHIYRLESMRKEPAPPIILLETLVQQVKEGKRPIKANNCFDLEKIGMKKESKSLQIALVSTPFFAVPPKGYSGLEMIVWDLACGLEQLGHEVTIFGPEGSKATLNGNVIITGKSNNTVNVDWFELEKENFNVYKEYITPDKFDIVHDHTWFGFPYLLKSKYPNLNIIKTHHGGFSWESPPPVSKPNLVAISQFMQHYTIQYFKQKGYNIDCKYVRNGIDTDKYPFQQTKSDRLLFVGRLSTFKQPTIAVELSRKTNHKLDIVGSASFVDNLEYVKQLDKLIENDPNIKIYKDASHEFKIEKMQNAKALIFPSKMNEPAGLCLLPESPILTLDRGVQKIKDVKIGDKVLTHIGRFMRISQLLKREYSGDMIRITPHKLKIPIILTPEHRVLAIKTVLCTNKSGNFTKYRTICSPGSCYYMKDGRQYKYCKYIKGEEPYNKYKTEWIEAKNLEVGDFVVYPRVNEKEIDIEKIRMIDYIDDFLNYIDDFLNVRDDGYDDNTQQTDIFGGFTEKIIGRFSIYEGSQIPAEIALTKDLMRLFGYYIAEGCTKAGRQLQFSFNLNEDEYVNDVEKLMKDIFGLEAQHSIEYQGEQSHILIYSNKILSNIFQNMFSPKEYINQEGKVRKAHIVRIPSEFSNLPLSKLAGLIKGEWRGDGTYLLDSKNKNNRVGYQMKTTSETLAYQLQYILSKFGILVSMRIDNSRSRYNKNCVSQYLLEIYGRDAKIFNKIIEDKEVKLDNNDIDSRYIKGKNLFYIPIKAIDIINYNGQVYNLDVEEDNSYVSTIIIHNCAMEAMSCGTPVIAFDDGAIKEYVINNRTGFICNHINEMIDALNKIHTIDPYECRKRAIELSRDVMAKNYENLYYKIISGNEW